jgi:pimeloyl-ACP methyl ester carboxylesterase
VAARNTARTNIAIPALAALFTLVATTANAVYPVLSDAIAPHFEVPARFAGKFGEFRSPLKFDDGSTVQSPADWPRRRAEILKYWTNALGPWPPLIENGKLEVLKEERRETFLQQRVTVTTAPGQTQEGWLLVPDGAGPFPAALVVFYEPETSTGMKSGPKQAFRDYALQLTRRGFVTLSIGSPGGDARKPDLAGATCQPLSFHAYVAVNCWHALANHPKVDAKRIGVVGHSYGGKWALFAGALWEKFACVAVSDPGIVWNEARPSVNYWEPWYLGHDPSRPPRKPGLPTPENPATGPYQQLRKDARDLTDIHALICPRPFLVSGGSEDPPENWIALNHSIAVNNLLGADHRIGMTNRPDHDPIEAANSVVWAFFEHFLAPTPLRR